MEPETVDSLERKINLLIDNVNETTELLRKQLLRDIQEIDDATGDYIPDK